MARITEYDFGRMVVDGRAFTSDLIILPGRVLSSWRRAAGHSLIPEDLDAVWVPGLRRLVVGTGRYGRMEVPQAARAHAGARGVVLDAALTGEAVTLFNRLAEEDAEILAGAFHLTC
ncbi:MAG: MTH938/NDUFAF3 family protein [Rhodospirillales bacterium]